MPKGGETIGQPGTITRRPKREGELEVMTLDGASHQKPKQFGRIARSTGEACTAPVRDEALAADQRREGSEREDLLQQALSRENLVVAWKHIKANKGSAGVDGLTIEHTVEHLKTHWPHIRSELLNGTYRPQAVRRVEIPKASGGLRELGVPTVTDRLIQQALLQVLQPLIDPTFSNFSYGFRPGRSAHDAVLKAQQYAREGFRVVVDVDLEKFFDRVNHDILMERLSRRVSDKAVLRLIRSYLKAGIMSGGVVMARDEGTPQGGVATPLTQKVISNSRG
jgi:RNA-directed DNA polymerase